MSHIQSIASFTSADSSINFHIVPKREVLYSSGPVRAFRGATVLNSAEYASDMIEIGVLADYLITEEWSWLDPFTAIFITVHGKYKVDEVHLDNRGRELARPTEHEHSAIFLMRPTCQSATDVRVKLYDYILHMEIGWERDGLKGHHHRLPELFLSFNKVALADR